MRGGSHSFPSYFFEDNVIPAHIHRIVIVGGGAGGLELAVRLAKAGEEDILLIDESDTHVWKPRIHELAAGMHRGYVDEVDYAGLAQHWGFAFEQGELRNVDPAAQTLSLAAVERADGSILVPEREIGYHVVVLALGGVTPDLGVDGVLENAILLDRKTDAGALSRHLAAGLLRHSLSAQNQPYNVAIVGSGLTGVELGAHLATDYQCATLAPGAAVPKIEITILEAADTFMPAMSDDVREAVSERLRQAGVAMEAGQKVTVVLPDSVETESRSFPAELTVWASGRVGPPVADKIDALTINKKRRWLTRPTLQSMVSDHIFALGDCSCIKASPVPPSAQAASEQAEHLAKQLPRYLNGELPKAFEFEDKGTLLSLGEAGTFGKVKGLLGDDLQVHGHFARAAYHGLQRQHQYLLLGYMKGTAELFSDALGRSLGPRLKVY